MPQFGDFALYSERCVKSFVALVAVINEIEVAVRKLAMDEKNTCIGFGFRILEIGRYVEALKHIR